MPPTSDSAPWWRRGTVYQVYPRSFADANGDGVGDLEGVRRRLDHLVELGVDALWLSPVFPSPMADFGYDVSDYTDIDPLFGSLGDFDALLAAAHERGLRLILDFVPSHTSERHPWFVESRASRESPKRDWYTWADPAPDGGPPNNWIGEFGGPAWTLDEATGQYWLHLFLPEQPALNWRNAEVRAAMLDVLRFWFDRGVDGFRVDAVLFLVVDAALRDNPPNPRWREGGSPPRSLLWTRTAHQAETHEAVREMRAVADAYAPERVLIGEVCASGLDEMMPYYGAALDGFQMPFNFELLTLEWSPGAIAAFVDAYEAALPAGAWPNWVLGNHDVSRVASRVGPARARLAAMLLLTLRGTPTIYQGEELGLEDARVPPEAVVDPWERRVPGIGLGRDPVRTPMPWTAAPGAGFTEAEPWLPIDPAHRERSVAAQREDPGSMLSLYRALLALRRAESALSIGGFRTLLADEDLLVYERTGGDRRLAVALNFGDAERSLPGAEGARVLLSTRGGGQGTGAAFASLAPGEGAVLAGADGLR